VNAAAPITGFPAIMVMLVVAILLSIVLIMVSRYLGPRRPNVVKSSPYESGMTPVGTTRERFGVHYYMVAMSFIIFDVEVVFMYPWALLLQRELGWYGLVMMGIFFFILVVGLIWEIKKGAIQWD
jgi:NADH-quinone oxidoreductase subunit A